MKRIFQHYEGKIQTFSGSQFSTVKAVVHAPDNSVMVLWLQEEQKRVWYRLFVDGIYCGIDQFSDDESLEDMDDDIIIVDHSAWFKGKTVLEAGVSSGKKGTSDIVVTLKFAESECRLVYRSEDNDCGLEFVMSSPPAV